MKLRKKAVSMALAASLAVSMVPGMPLAPAAGAEASAEETQETVKVPAMTIADTYYSVNGEFPLYVQYNYKGSNKLAVMDADSGALLGEWSVYGSGLCKINGITGIKSGDSRRLIFIIKGYDGEEIERVTKTVSFEDKNVWTSREYLTVDEIGLNKEFYINLCEEPAITSPRAIDGIYFRDKNNKIAVYASGLGVSGNNISYDRRYDGIFENVPSYSDWKFCRIFTNANGLHPLRELVPGETMTVEYSIDGITYPVDGLTISVTDKPYIYNVSVLSNYFAGENLFALEVDGSNVDFNKLNFKVKAGDITVGKSVSYVPMEQGAYYIVQWEENHNPQENCYYEIEFDDPELLVGDSVKGFIYSSNDQVEWNPKTNSIEYYNKDFPAGAELYYWMDRTSVNREDCSISGRGITVDANHHAEIPLTDILDNLETGNNFYSFNAAYMENGELQYGPWGGAYVYPNKQIKEEKDKNITSSSLNRSYYLSNQESFTFSAKLSCNDESSLLVSCGAVIKNNDGEEVGKVSLAKKKEDNNLFYEGIYQGSLEPGKYSLVFYPDDINKEEICNCSFKVTGSDKLYLTSQNNEKDFTNIRFGSKENLDWYCSEENRQKISLHITDVGRNNEKVYKLSEGDFTYSYQYSDIVDLIYSETMKEALEEMGYYEVYVYYDDQIALTALDPPVRELYDYSDGYSKIAEKVEGSDVGLPAPSSYGKNTFSSVSAASKEAFPVKVMVSDWYSVKIIAEFTIEESGGIPKNKLEGLSEQKLYNIYLEGSDGSRGNFFGYLVAGKESQPETTPGEEDKPGTTPGEEDKPGTTPGEEDKPGTTPEEEDKPGTTPGEEDKPGTTPGGSTGGTGGSTSTGGNTGGTIVGGGTSGTTGNVTGTGSTGNAGTTSSDNSNTADDKKPEDNQQQDNTQTNNNPANTEQQGNSGNTQTPETSNTASDNNSDKKEETKEKGKLTLEKKKITVEKGKNAKIEITSDVNTKVTYTSSDPSIATVNKNGKIIAKKKGTVTITVSANGKEKEVTVTVEPAKKASTIKLSKKMKLSDTKTSLKKGAKLTIKKAAGTGKVTYRSSNSKIATVSAKGVIKAKKKGTVTIFVENGKKTVKLKITVKG